MTTDSFDSAGSSADLAGANLSNVMDGLQTRTTSLTVGANSFSTAMARAFTQASVGGKQLDDVLKSLALRLSTLTVTQAFKPIVGGLTGGLQNLFGGLFGTNTNNLVAAMGAIKPFAAGGVIGTPTYFPLQPGGLGLAGEAGPEAILPLGRTADGRLGVAAGGSAPTNVTVQIMTPDADSFRRSEAYLTGQIARAVARGQRSL